MNMLTHEQLQWIADNISIFVSNNSATEEQRKIVYDMYFDLTGIKKKPNSCGRCWRGVKDTVLKNYKTQTNIF